MVRDATTLKQGRLAAWPSPENSNTFVCLDDSLTILLSLAEE
jgi:hypothetical protein